MSTRRTLELVCKLYNGRYCFICITVKENNLGVTVNVNMKISDQCCSVALQLQGIIKLLS